MIDLTMPEEGTPGVAWTSWSRYAYSGCATTDSCSLGTAQKDATTSLPSVME